MDKVKGIHDLRPIEDLIAEDKSREIANRQMHRDIREYRYEKRRKEYAATSKSGGGLKERQRRLAKAQKSCNLKVDLRGVPGPEEGSREGDAGQSVS